MTHKINCGFYIFSWKFDEKASQIQNFRILETLVDFKFNFQVWNKGLKTFRKALASKFSWEREKERAFLKVFSPLLQTWKLNLKSMSGSKILKIWIWEALLTYFQEKI